VDHPRERAEPDRLVEASLLPIDPRDADVEARDRRVGPRRDLLGEAAGDAEHAGDVVGGAERHDRQREPGAGDDAGGPAEGAVAAGGDDQIASLGERAGELVLFGRMRGDLVPGPGDLVDQRIGAMVFLTRRRVVHQDHTHPFPDSRFRARLAHAHPHHQR